MEQQRPSSAILMVQTERGRGRRAREWKGHTGAPPLQQAVGRPPRQQAASRGVLAGPPRGAAAHQLCALFALAAAQHVHERERVGAGAVGCQQVVSLCRQGGSGGDGGAAARVGAGVSGGVPSGLAPQPPKHGGAPWRACCGWGAQHRDLTPPGSRPHSTLLMHRFVCSPQRLASDSTRSPQWHSALKSISICWCAKGGRWEERGHWLGRKRGAGGGA